MRVRLISDRFRMKHGRDYRYFTKGDVFEVDGAELDRLIKLGAVAEDKAEVGKAFDVVEASMNDHEKAAAEAEDEDTDESDGPKRPLNAASKALWVAYAVEMGKPEAEMKKLDKPEIQALFA